MLDRDELAARCLVAIMSNPSSRGTFDAFAREAVTFADALLARLCGDGDPRSDTNIGLPTWEPCAAPVAPSAPPAVPASRGCAGMNRAEVHRLVRDLKRFRAAFTWTINGDNRDAARRAVDESIRFARQVLAHGGLYSLACKVLDGEEVPS